jgi:peptidoglycan/xylan/chitin deacetylase (PgdA/CDA1 family)
VPFRTISNEMIRLSEVLLRCACRLGAGIILNYHTLSRCETLAHVEFFGRYFEFISHDELLCSLRTTRRRPFCFLTFDDGKKSNATEVAPALRELGVPAAFYIPTGFVAARDRPLWFDRVSALWAHVPDLPNEVRIDVLKRLPSRTRDARVDDACRRYGIDADMTNDHVCPMSWDDVRALHAQGFTIGSHSEWHAVLPAETLEYAKADIANSIERISVELSGPCTTFSFPNGNCTEPLALHAQGCGVATVFTTEPTWAGPNSKSLRLPRIQLFPERGTTYLAIKVAAARVPGVLGNPNGTGRSYAGLEAIRGLKDSFGDRHV